jgi:hypothetical protein
MAAWWPSTARHPTSCTACCATASVSSIAIGRARIHFEVRSRNEYFDMAPIRRLYRRHPDPDGAAGRVAEPRR